jgi:putative ABC transport system permease protein
MSLGTVRLRSGLVALEVALALVLLTGCGLLARSVSRLRSVDPGIEAENLALVQVHLLPSYDSDEERRAFFQDLQDRIGALPGVISVSHVADPPMGFHQQSPQLWREEDAVRGEASESGNLHRVGLEYFRTMGIPLLRGRSFSGADDADAPPVLVLSQGMAERLWPGEDPLGRLINLSKDHDGPWYTVVGVVGDIRQNSLRSGPGMDLYAPYAQNPADRGLFMAVRTAGEPLDLSGALREAVWSIDRNIPVPEITTMKGRVDATLRLDRFRALLLAAFAGVALLLATTGIYGTLTYVVGRRTPEVGIRMALGADAGAVVWMVLRQGVTPVMVGVVLGLAGSLAATRVLESFLFEVSPNDPLTFGVVASVLMGVSLLASYFPARRASRVDPQQALRAE